MQEARANLAEYKRLEQLIIIKWIIKKDLGVKPPPLSTEKFLTKPLTSTFALVYDNIFLEGIKVIVNVSSFLGIPVDGGGG